jgi:hypothetical protein
MAFFSKKGRYRMGIPRCLWCSEELELGKEHVCLQKKAGASPSIGEKDKRFVPCVPAMMCGGAPPSTQVLVGGGLSGGAVAVVNGADGDTTAGDSILRYNSGRPVVSCHQDDDGQSMPPVAVGPASETDDQDQDLGPCSIEGCGGRVRTVPGADGQQACDICGNPSIG